MDISDPSNPTSIGRVLEGAAQIRGAAVSNDGYLAYLAAGDDVRLNPRAYLVYIRISNGRIWRTYDTGLNPCILRPPIFSQYADV